MAKHRPVRAACPTVTLLPTFRSLPFLHALFLFLIPVPISSIGRWFVPERSGLHRQFNVYAIVSNLLCLSISAVPIANTISPKRSCVVGSVSELPRHRGQAPLG